MNKKGFLFTIFTLLVLVSLLLISFAYLDWFSSYKQNVVFGMSNAHKISYISDDISYDLADLFDFNDFTITRDNGRVFLTLNNIFNTTKDYNVSLEDYFSFVENGYSDEVKADVILDDVSYSMDVSGYNITSYQVGQDYYVTTDDYQSILAINLTVTLYNVSVLTNTFSPNDDGDSYPWVHVTVYNKYGDLFLKDSKRLNPTQNNPRFTVNFLTGDDLDVYFENNPQDGSLHLNYEYNFTVDELVYTMVDNNQSISFGMEGNIFIDPHVSDIERYTELVAVEG
ncbi:MAG: hypothetical protein ABIJ18_00325 [archaeon]